MNAARRTSTKVEETCTVLLRALRHAVERQPISALEVKDIARAQLMRPGGPAHRVTAPVRKKLEDALEVLCRQFDGPPTSRTLYAFAKAAAEAAHTLERSPRHPGVRVAERIDDDVRSLAQAALYAEAMQSKDGEDMVRRAVTRALRERKRSGGLTRVRLEDGDPLRALLDLPRKGRVLLPRNDLRARISETSNKTGLGAVLRKAARFSEELVRPALGEELWELGRPVGFTDQAETRVIMEVSSSVCAQEIQLRSQEICEKLRGAGGFSRVSAVHIVLRSPSALPVVGRRAPHLRQQ